MRGKKAKEIKKMVLARLKELNKDFIMVSPLTEQRPNTRRPWATGTLVLDKDCFRKMYRDTKYMYKKIKRNDGMLR